MEVRPAFSGREHSDERMRLPSQPLLMQSWKGARMALWAEGVQPAKEDWRSWAMVLQIGGQEVELELDWRVRMVGVEVVRGERERERARRGRV